MEHAPYPGGPGYQRHSATSREAADRVGKTLDRTEQQIVDWMALRGAQGATIDEVAVYLEEIRGERVNTGTASARMRGLEKATRVVKTTAKRATRTGFGAHVYLLPEFAGHLGQVMPPSPPRVRQHYVPPLPPLPGTIEVVAVGHEYVDLTKPEERAKFFDQRKPVPEGPNPSGQAPEIRMYAPGVSKHEQERQRLRQIGHGYVVERADKRKGKCGGPSICKVCRSERDYLEFLKKQEQK